MTATKAYISSLIVTLAVFGLLLLMLFIGVARSDELPLVPGKFYVTVALVDKNTHRQYAKLMYNPAGAFDTNDACIQWLINPPEEFMEQGAELLTMAKNNFGPDVVPVIACDTPTPPAAKDNEI